MSVNIAKDKILRYTGKYYNESYALATLGMPHIDHYVNMALRSGEITDHEMKSRWEKLTIDQIAEFEENVLPKHEDEETKYESGIPELMRQEPDKNGELNIYADYHRVMKKYLYKRNYAHVPSLAKVLTSRFLDTKFERGPDLELWRAWKAGAVRRMPLRVEEITQCRDKWEALCKARHAKVDFDFIAEYQTAVFQAESKVERIQRELGQIERDIRTIKKLENEPMTEQESKTMNDELKRLETKQHGTMKDLTYVKCENDLRSYRLYSEVMKIPNFVSSHTHQYGNQTIKVVTTNPAKTDIDPVFRAFGARHAETRLATLDRFHLVGELARFNDALREFVKFTLGLTEQVKTGPLVASFIEEALEGNKGLYTNDKKANANLRVTQFSPLGCVYAPFVTSCFEPNRTHQFYTECQGRGHNGELADMCASLTVVPDGDKDPKMIDDTIKQLYTSQSRLLDALQVNYQVRELPLRELAYSSARTVSIYVELDGRLVHYANITYRRQFVAEKLSMHCRVRVFYLFFLSLIVIRI